MPAPAVPCRIPGLRTLAVGTATTLAALGLALLPDAAATGVDYSDSCALRAGPGLDEGPTGQRYVRPEGRGKATMIMVDFPDLPAGGPAGERASFFADYGREYLSQASYGQYALDFEATEDWIRMPRSWASYDIRRGIGPAAMRTYVQDALDAAHARGTDFADSDFVYVVADDNVPAQPTVSQANVFDDLRAGGHPLRGAALVFGHHSDSATWQRGNFVHEAQHIYGLPDLYNVRDGASVEFTGGWDPMSMAGISDLLGWHKWKLGWLSDGQVRCLPHAYDGTLTQRLTPIGAPDGANIAVLRTSPRTAIVAEARTRVGLDRSICAEGVLLYTVDSGVPSGHGPVRVVDTEPHSDGGPSCADRTPAQLAELGDAPLQAGESHTLADGTRLTVTKRSRGESGTDEYTVRVSGS
ncbi:peptidase M6 [Streptomyces oceani]|uniref:Peptidase M6 n=1 Tax=Streptomyces oceani TaxID=1075402 RepID=A0A1E7JZJ0_9ACTN|nr:peptidase M6 [Streptomyces oceani]OEU97072.1 peptidase M6 [Streptomyces oceani]